MRNIKWLHGADVSLHRADDFCYKPLAIRPYTWKWAVGRVTESLPRNDVYALILFLLFFLARNFGPAAATPAAPAPTALYTGQQSLHRAAELTQDSLHSTAETRGHVPRPHLLRIKATPSTYQKSNRRLTIENRKSNRQSNRRSTIENRKSNRRSTIENRLSNRKSTIESKIDNGKSAI